MRLLLKVLVVLIAIPVLVLGLGFVRQLVWGGTVQVEAPEQETGAVESPGWGGAALDGKPAARRGLGLGPFADAAAVKAWFVESKFFYLEDGFDEVLADRAAIADMTVAEAVAIHSTLLHGDKEYAGLRLTFFAWMGLLDRDSRREFADQVGAVYRAQGGLFARAYQGDFVGLFYLQKNDPYSAYALAVRAYCEILSHKEIIQALTQFNVIRESSGGEQWDIRVESRLGEFDAMTILAIRDAVDTALFGKVNYLRKQLGDFAETKSE